MNGLKGKVAVVTGANSGIGKYTVKDFFKRSARVIIACRDLEKAKSAIDDIKRECKNDQNLGELSAVQLDLTSLKSVRKCAEKLLETEKNINILVNNAGVMMCPYLKTEDGYETHFATNHLGHFLLTLLLMPKLIESRPTRIVNVSSNAHKFIKTLDLSDLEYNNTKYNSLTAYSRSKLANILFTKELARRLEDSNIKDVNVYTLHPGVIKTDLGRHVAKRYYFPGLNWLWNNLAPYLVKNPEQGAQTQIYCAVDEKCANETGLYYCDCKVAKTTAAAKDKELAKELWEVSLKMVGLKEDYNYISPSKIK